MVFGILRQFFWMLSKIKPRRIKYPKCCKCGKRDETVSAWIKDNIPEAAPYICEKCFFELK